MSCACFVLSRNGGWLRLTGLELHAYVHLLVEPSKDGHQPIDREAVEMARRMREKSAAAIPVSACAWRPVICRLSSVLMICAARRARSCSRSGLGMLRPRKTLPLPRTSSKSSLIVGLLQPFQAFLDPIDISPRGGDT